jgi:hypothetical protein
MSLHIDIFSEVCHRAMPRATSHRSVSFRVLNDFRHRRGELIGRVSWHNQATLPRRQHGRGSPGRRNPSKTASHRFEKSQRGSFIVRSENEYIGFPQEGTDVSLHSNEFSAVEYTEGPSLLASRETFWAISNHYETCVYWNLRICKCLDDIHGPLL